MGQAVVHWEFWSDDPSRISIDSFNAKSARPAGKS